MILRKLMFFALYCKKINCVVYCVFYTDVEACEHLNKEIHFSNRVAGQVRFREIGCSLNRESPKTRTLLCSGKRAYFDIKRRNSPFNWTKSLREKKIYEQRQTIGFSVMLLKIVREVYQYTHIGLQSVCLAI